MTIPLRLIAAIAATLMGLAILASPAAAKPRKVLVLPFEGALGGKAPSNGLERLTAVVARSAGLTGATVRVGQASFSDTAALVGCGTEEADCLGQVAKSLGVDQVITGSVETGADGSSVIVNLKFFKDGETRDERLELPAPSFDAVLEGVARDVPDLFVSAPERRPDARATDTAAPAAGSPDTPATANPIETPPPVAIAPPPQRDSGGFDVRRVGIVAWGTAGVGLVAAGAGGVFLALARDRQQQVDDAPVSSGADLERLEELEDEGARFTTLGNGLLIGGGGLLAAGAVLIAIQGLSGSAEDRPIVSIGPLGDGAGIHLTFGAP